MGIQTKHFVNAPSDLVIESLHGLCTLNPHIKIDEGQRVVYLADQDKSKVALICGGGSGHEPAHAGFVGKGMLSAAVCGNIFASPSAAQVRRGIELADNAAGTLIIVKNYTGDVLNFGLAKEQFAAAYPGKAKRVKFLNIGDDVAVGKTQGSIVGRRGLAGVVLVYKIAGALAETGAPLEEVYSVADWVSKRLATIGVGLDHCHVPGTAVAESHLQAGEIEIGMGIHNEPGIKRLSPVPSLHGLVEQLLEMLLSQSDSERSFLPISGKGDEVALLINNLGGTSELELGAIVREVSVSLAERNVIVRRVISGTFMTSLNMPGFSITLLLLPSSSEANAPTADFILRLLDAPTSAPGWNWSPAAPAVDAALHQAPNASDAGATSVETKALRSQDSAAFDAAVKRACTAINKEEPEITRMDTIAGDGDCGLTLQTGANAVLKEMHAGSISGNDVVAGMIIISDIAGAKMGGTSGALYSIFFSALAQGLQVATSADQEVTNVVWSKALSYALEKLYTYTRARPPSRTLVDPLDAFAKAFSNQPNDFRSAVPAAVAAAERTRDIEAKAGRSAYVESDMLKRERVPDPGAWGVKVILEAIAAHDS